MTTHEDMLRAMQREQTQPRIVAQPIKTKKSIDWPIALAKVAAWLTLASFGLVIWAINGGFSVLGLEVIARSFNDSGTLFWSAMSKWTITIPALGSPLPVLPWCGVIASSILQVVTIYLTLIKRPMPKWIITFSVLISIYDYSTTFFGLSTTQWLTGSSWLIQGLIAGVLTFILEITLGYILYLTIRKR